MNIKGFDNYLIYPNGLIWSKPRERAKGKFIPHTISTNGYKMVMLWKDGKRKNCSLHRLLATHFIANPQNNKIIDHIDRNRLNNSLDNLRWVSYSLNNSNKKSSNKSSNITGITIKTTTKGHKRYLSSFKRHRKTFKTLDEALEFRKRMIIEHQS